MILIEVNLVDLSGLRLLPRSTVGEGEAAGAAVITFLCIAPEGQSSSSIVLPSRMPNSAVFVEVAPPDEAAPDDCAVEGASNIPSKAGSIGGALIRLITYQRSLRRIHARHVVLIRSSSRRVTCANVPAGRFSLGGGGRDRCSRRGLDILEPIVGSREVRINYIIAQIGANRIQYHSSHVMRILCMIREGSY